MDKAKCTIEVISSATLSLLQRTQINSGLGRKTRLNTQEFKTKPSTKRNSKLSTNDLFSLNSASGDTRTTAHQHDDSFGSSEEAKKGQKTDDKVLINHVVSCQVAKTADE